MKASSLALLVCLSLGALSSALANQGTAPPQHGPEEESGPQWEQRKFEEALNLIHVGVGTPVGLDPAYKVLKEISKRNPNSPYLFAAAAELQYISYMNSGGTSAQEVRALAYRAIQLKQDLPDAYVVLAKVEANEGNVFEAQKAANTAIKLAPSKPEAMFAMAQAAEAASDFNAAESWYMKDIGALSSAERKANIYFWLGKMHLKKTPPDAPKAIDAMRKSIELQPNHSWKLAHYAYVLNQYTDRYDEAIEWANAALKLRDSADNRKVLAGALYAKWAKAYLAPAGSAEKKQVLSPEEIARRTRVTPVAVFAGTGRNKGGLLTAEALLKAGLVKDVDAVPSDACCTALLAAAQGDNLELVRLLLARGANVNAQDTRDKRTALYEFAVQGEVTGVQLLLSKGARVNIVDAHALPLVHAALRARTPNSLVITRELLKAGADPSLPNSSGANLLIAAVQKQDGAAVKMLLSEYRMDPNSADAVGRTPLAWIVNAVGPNRIETVRTLLAAGSNPWIKWGATDALEMVETYQANQSQLFPEHREIAALLRDARRRFPKPADFPEWQPPTHAQR